MQIAFDVDILILTARGLPSFGQSHPVSHVWGSTLASTATARSFALHVSGENHVAFSKIFNWLNVQYVS